MWSHYADSHMGACLEFDTNKLFEKIDSFDAGTLSSDNPITYTIPFKS